MTPRAILVWSTATLIVVVSDANPFTRLFLLLAALSVMVALFPRDVSLRAPFKLIGFGTLLAILISASFDHVGTHILFMIPSGIPVLGGAITLEGLTYGVATGIGLAAGLACVMPLAYTLDPTDLVDAIPRRLERVGAVLALSLSLLPRVRRSATSIAEAQHMRGYQARRLRHLADVAVPVVLSAVEDSMVTAQAMEARGFGSGPRTNWGVQQWSRTGATAAAMALTAAFLVMAAPALGWHHDWFPFPSFTTPSLEVTGVVAALLCCVPGLLKRL
jgi:energy-coupling factor transport system permease protein